MTVKEFMHQLEKLNPRHDADVQLQFKSADGQVDPIQNEIVFSRTVATAADPNPPVYITLVAAVIETDEIELTEEEAVI